MRMGDTSENGIAYIEVSSPEAAPDAITSLNLDWREIAALRNGRVDSNVTPDTGDRRVQS